MKIDVKEQIIKYGKELHLPIFRQMFDDYARQAAKETLSYEEYLLMLMEAEFDNRIENRKKAYIRQAGFPQKHYLHELERALLPKPAIQKLPELERLDFIQEGRNLVLAGNPGTGGRLPGRLISLQGWVLKLVNKALKSYLLLYLVYSHNYGNHTQNAL